MHVVKSAEQALAIARGVLRKNFSDFVPTSAVLADDRWMVTCLASAAALFNVGVTVDAVTGRADIGAYQAIEIDEEF